jgi:TctA family transporter
VEALSTDAEDRWRLVLILSNGELAIFLQRPISGALLLLTVVVLAASALSGRRALGSVTPR